VALELLIQLRPVIRPEISKLRIDHDEKNRTCDYRTTIGGEEYTNCNDRELRGPIVTAEDKPNARKRARNKARTELLRKLNVGGKIESRDRILANLGTVNVYERASGDGEYAYNAIMDITLCDRPE